MCKRAHSLTPMTLHHHHRLSSAPLSEIQFGIIPIRHSLSHNDKVAGGFGIDLMVLGEVA